jgi:hypothetical protein
MKAIGKNWLEVSVDRHHDEAETKSENNGPVVTKAKEQTASSSSLSEIRLGEAKGGGITSDETFL